MDPTPVRIRGKKRNRVLVSFIQSQIAPPAKRLQTTTSGSKRAARLIKSKQMAYKAATPTLQGLPQELIDSVFLHSINISLPRASHDLGRKLSSKWVCMEYTMRTFFHTLEHKTPIREKVGEITSDKDVQSNLMACRFFTWPFFLAYVEKAHAAIIQLRGKAWAKTGVAMPGVGHFDGLWPFKFRKIDYLGLAEGFRVPEKLLHGPWTADKSSLLYVLVSLSGEIDWTESMAGETAKEGLAQAVEEGNERAVAALSVLLGVSNAITTGMLRHAVVECGCDFKILRHLLFNAQILYKDASKEALDLHDPVLWQWADGEGEEVGKGETLKDMLKSAEKFDLEFYSDDESDWASIVPFPYSGDKFDARTGLDGTTRELLARLYATHGRSIVRRRQAAHRPRHESAMGAQVEFP